MRYWIASCFITIVLTIMSPSVALSKSSAGVLDAHVLNGIKLTQAQGFAVLDDGNG